MILSAAASILFAAAALASNPKVLSPNNMTYSAGDVVEIRWEVDTGLTGFLNIDLVDVYSDVLQFPMTIASGVPSEAGKYSWKVPSELKTAAGYNVRVWGTQPPNTDGGAKNGISSSFTILNALPNAVTTFTVVTPSKDKPCLAGTTCYITWDYPRDSMHPAAVDIALYRVGNPTPMMHIATVESSLKSYSWHVPEDAHAMGGDVYISVSGQGMPIAGPAMGNEMGGNSRAFLIGAQPPPSAEVKSETESKDEEKEHHKKDEKKIAKKPVTEQKLVGVTKENANAAASTVKAAAVLVAAAALVPLALIL